MLSGMIESMLVFWLSGSALLVAANRFRIPGQYVGSFQISVRLALPMGLGLLFRYAAELIIGNSQGADLLCVAVGAVSIPTLVRDLVQLFATFKSAPRQALKRLGGLAIFIVIWGPLACLCLFDPIILGDAKEIWFFHAKIIFYANGIHQNSGFSAPSILFSHPDYPKLLPVIGSTMARFNGAWNDHVPKFSVALLLLPTFAFAADLLVQRRIFAGLIFLALVWSGGGPLLYSGYVDPILSASIALMVLALFFAVESGDNDLFGVAALAGALIINLKAEGLPLLGLTLPAFLWALDGNVRRKSPFTPKVILPLVLAGICYAVWANWAVRLGLVNDMSGDKGAAWGRFISRVGDQAQWQLCLDYFGQFIGSGVILAAILIANLAFYIARPDLFRRKLALAANLAALSYAAFMLLVYLSTHHDLAWHLHYSSYRTLMSAQTLMGMSLVLMSGAGVRT